ncbi:hypothetical protein X275_06910 [Marinitoga sp. 1197]|uniref:hypothetical protein n=1 Tax=Marinitoga sp. 1197 TaxID=1428449 RepID=UPI000657E493|nr:hypothetical protein [Marinitoga sp. 1197]KLO22094.1 hypothetical protein X275_06910 [Marinitoga sp. 1197]
MKKVTFLIMIFLTSFVFGFEKEYVFGNIVLPGINNSDEIKIVDNKLNNLNTVNLLKEVIQPKISLTLNNNFINLSTTISLSSIIIENSKVFKYNLEKEYISLSKRQKENEIIYRILNLYSMIYNEKELLELYLKVNDILKKKENSEEYVQIINELENRIYFKKITIEEMELDLKNMIGIDTSIKYLNLCEDPEFLEILKGINLNTNISNESLNLEISRLEYKLNAERLYINNFSNVVNFYLDTNFETYDYGIRLSLFRLSGINLSFDYSLKSNDYNLSIYISFGNIEEINRLNSPKFNEKREEYYYKKNIDIMYKKYFFYQEKYNEIKKLLESLNFETATTENLIEHLQKYENFIQIRGIYVQNTLKLAKEIGILDEIYHK